VTMLAEQCDVVVGVDTHRDTHTAAFVDPVGGVGDTMEIAANPRGYRTLLIAGERQAARRVWAVEGTGSYGAGLTRFLRAAGERVVEVERPVRSARRNGKSDALDAIRAARDVLARDQQIEPRQHGDREATECCWRRGKVRWWPGRRRSTSSEPWWSLHPSRCGHGWLACRSVRCWVGAHGCGLALR
jgi:hypothetical protein